MTDGMTKTELFNFSPKSKRHLFMKFLARVEFVLCVAYDRIASPSFLRPAYRPKTSVRLPENGLRLFGTAVHPLTFFLGSQASFGAF